MERAVVLEVVRNQAVRLLDLAPEELTEKVSFGYKTISWTVGNVTQGWDVAANQSL